MKTIGLCMIVKNETQVILRCLDSVRPLVDYVLIEDTGSTDGTQAMIREWLQRENVPGEVIEEPWQDFAFNRSHALERLRAVSHVDYALIIDADDQLRPEPGFDAAGLKAGLRDEMYDVQIQHNGLQFYRPQLLANRLPFRFKAVLHEYLESPPGPISRSTVAGFYVETGRGGARSQNPLKYQQDAAALEQALTTETDPFLLSRYTFYLAQSYRDFGDRERALLNYQKRATQGYWVEEIYQSVYQAAAMQEALGVDPETVLAGYTRATELVPARMEALHAAARFCRLQGRYQQAYELAKRGAGMPIPPGALFVESWVYEYGLWDELGISAFWCGRFRESLDACLRALGGTALPAEQRERVARNAQSALERLPATPHLGPIGQQDFRAQHALAPERKLRSRVPGVPPVLLSIIGQPRENTLPLFLECLDALDYPKSALTLHVQVLGGTEAAQRLLADWIGRAGQNYHAVELAPVSEPAEGAALFKAMGRMRDAAMHRAAAAGCGFAFLLGLDSFVRPCTLRELLALDMPLVSPLLRAADPDSLYSNYHAEIDTRGYYKPCAQYEWILNRWVQGVIEVPVVHTACLIRADVMPQLSHQDASGRHDYVIFSDTARRAGIVQNLDNRQVYGYVLAGDETEQRLADGMARARAALFPDSAPAPAPTLAGPYGTPLRWAPGSISVKLGEGSLTTSA